MIEKESQADDLEIRLRSEHMKRLATNRVQYGCGNCISWTHLVCLERISDHSRNIAEEVLTVAN